MGTLFLKLLDQLEGREFRSLTWGYVDGSFSRDQLRRFAENVLATAAADGSPDDLIEDLFQRKLIFEGDGRIRSRFAETLRLLVRLRQLFPGRPWQAAPRLVSDFRVDVRRRRYPLRDRKASRVAEESPEIFGTSKFRADLWDLLAIKDDLRLAGFQERALLRILSSDGESGTIVTAGTGSGKTMAFYLPILLSLAEEVRRGEHWTKTLAVYPRNELLKDQFEEAYRQARKLDVVLSEAARRPILIGTLFGSTPNQSNAQSLEGKWVKRRGEYVCPWLKCPNCGSELIWTGRDIVERREVLRCVSTECGHLLPESTIVLTRERIAREPPDILFTTTEMLNQRMCDMKLRTVFGIGQPVGRRPKFALLDEVHTYSGTSGAQAALVLRRWRYMVDGTIVWVGLSATLREAPRFFAELTGLSLDNIAEVTPIDEEMVAEGAEYQVILQGDPTLQASLLSTSIQSAMLIGRALDPSTQSTIDSYFGRRLFVFTDDLDVTNRLYDNLRDAEAYDIFGRPDARRLPLAALRGNAEPRDPRRNAEGQRWRMCEQIGRTLDDRLRIGRTTSQDTGVLDNADVIVATAALEVGYNDNEVGAILQHKAPKGIASFLQRKGRAGRKRGMRPFTVTVLSDYGRDRLAYQAYEHLFDPVVPSQSLPIQNQYVLRMQAVFAFIDWVGAQAGPQINAGWLWDLLSRPVTYYGGLRSHIRRVLTGLVRGEVAYVNALTMHLEKALAISRDVATSLMWDPPRSLMLEVIPTLTRRYFRDWELAFPDDTRKRDLQRDFHPVPDFIPRALFSDLSLPEVRIILPAATTRDQETEDVLPILAALLQLAPGRVTRRFAFQRGGLNHWVRLDPSVSNHRLPIAQYAEENEFLGEFTGKDIDGDTRSLPVYRPWTIRLEAVRGKEVLPTSMGIPKWFSNVSAEGDPIVVDVPPQTAWFEFVQSLRFYLHRFRGSVLVRRFAHEVHATLRTQLGDRIVDVNFASPDDRDAAVGFELEVDGFAIDFLLPIHIEQTPTGLPPELAASARHAYFRYKLLSDRNIEIGVNALQREWIFQVFLSATISRAVDAKLSLGEAAKSVLSNDPARTFARTLRALFQIRDSDVIDEQTDAEGEQDVVDDTRRVSRLEERLTESIARADVLACLFSVAHEMDSVDPAQFGAWLRTTVRETLAQAVLQACIATAPVHAAVDSLLADIEVYEDVPGKFRIWISETTLGGAGVVQAFAEAFSADPRSLFLALEAALAPSDLEISSNGLSHFLSLATGDRETKEIVRQVRNAADHDSRAKLQKTLFGTLSRKGLDVGHALGVSLNARLLRVGISDDLDELLLELIRHWEALEARYGVSLGVREFCTIAIELPSIRSRLQTIVIAAGAAQQSSVGDLVQVLNALLWPRGMEIRQKSLQSYNPFRTLRVTDPGLVRELLLRRSLPCVYLTDSLWKEKYAAQLAKYGTVELVVDRSKESMLRAAIVETVAKPVDVGYMQFYPMVERFERSSASSKLTLSLRERV